MTASGHDFPGPVVCLMGPTASGKTASAIMLADALPCELISVDSALIYRGMDIGTAKPSPVELQSYPHRLVDIRDPSETYSAAEFQVDALREIQAAQSRGRIAVLVGGTMLYFRALQEGLANLPRADEAVRARILERALDRGWAFLHAELSAVDPESAQRIKSSDTQRLQRALEVYYLTGKSLSSHWAKQRQQRPADIPRFINIVVAPAERKTLHRRIKKRLYTMVERGFEEEVRSLRDRGDLNLEMPAVRAVGYRQMWQFLEGELEHAEMVERAVIATRQLAKRQLTWLRSWPNTYWFDSENSNYQRDILKLMNNLIV